MGSEIRRLGSGSYPHSYIIQRGTFPEMFWTVHEENEIIRKIKQIVG
jgi:hypothetical protein